MLYLILALLWGTLLIASWKKLQIWRWKNNLNISKHANSFYRITRDINGFALSKQARGQRDAFEYVYGEIEFVPFIALLSLCHPDRETVFYDLGSGTGKAVLACAMVFPVKKICGIELFAALHRVAELQHQRLNWLNGYQETAKKIHFIHANFLETNLDDATLIFINSTGYFGDTWEKINHRLEQLTTSPKVITTSKPLSSSHYQVKHTTRIQMSWGVVNAYIQVKIIYQNQAANA